MRWLHPSRRLLLCLSAVVGTIAGTGIPVIATTRVVGDGLEVPSPVVQFMAAQDEARFALWSLAGLDAELVHVLWDEQTIEGGADQETVFSADLWYRLPSGDVVHVWQTDNPFLRTDGKDPLSQPGGHRVVLPNGTSWYARTLPSDAMAEGILSHYDASTGITISMDIDMAELDPRTPADNEAVLVNAARHLTRSK